MSEVVQLYNGRINVEEDDEVADQRDTEHVRIAFVRGARDGKEDFVFAPQGGHEAMYATLITPNQASELAKALLREAGAD